MKGKVNRWTLGIFSFPFSWTQRFSLNCALLLQPQFNHMLFVISFIHPHLHSYFMHDVVCKYKFNFDAFIAESPEFIDWYIYTHIAHTASILWTFNQIYVSLNEQKNRDTTVHRVTSVRCVRNYHSFILNQLPSLEWLWSVLSVFFSWIVLACYQPLYTHHFELATEKRKKIKKENIEEEIIIIKHYLALEQDHQPSARAMR